MTGLYGPATHELKGGGVYAPPFPFVEPRMNTALAAPLQPAAVKIKQNYLPRAHTSRQPPSRPVNADNPTTHAARISAFFSAPGLLHDQNFCQRKWHQLTVNTNEAFSIIHVSSVAYHGPG